MNNKWLDQNNKIRKYIRGFPNMSNYSKKEVFVTNDQWMLEKFISYRRINIDHDYSGGN